MAVVAAFTSDVVAGVTPLTVNFTDTSTGSPTNWLWDFGDGFTSDDQHPTHIYEDNGAYTVTLRAFISDGSTNITPSVLASLTKNSSPPTWDPSNAVAHARFSSKSLGSVGGSNPGYLLQRRDDLGGFNYAIWESSFSFDLTGLSSGIAILRAGFGALAGGLASGAIFSSGKILIATTPVNTLFSVEDVTNDIGSTFLTTCRDINSGTVILSDPPDGTSKGWGIDRFNFLKITHHSLADEDDEDTEIKTNYIVAGPPIAAFSGTPLLGDNPLSVDFTDLSLGPVTSRSWRRRKSGSGDAFVEFSTAQNPTEIFDKTNP